MSPYAYGILTAFAVPLCHGLANILDSGFANRDFRRIGVLIFFVQLTNFLLIPVVAWLSHPTGINLRISLVLLLISIVEVFYQFLYYRALQHADTSIVSSLFSLGKIAIPLMAFFLVGERLSHVQYAGFLITILAGTFLTLDLKQWRINKAFLLMLAVSVGLGFQSVLYKYAFEIGATWGTVAVWSACFEFGIASLFMVSRENRIELSDSSKALRNTGPRLLLMQGLTWIGSQLSTYALFLIPVTVAEGVENTQPIFVLLYAILLKRKFPDSFRENVRASSVGPKVLLFSVIIVGTVLITLGEN